MYMGVDDYIHCEGIIEFRSPITLDFTSVAKIDFLSKKGKWHKTHRIEMMENKIQSKKLCTLLTLHIVLGVHCKA